MTDTFVPPVAPSYSSAVGVQYRVLKADFGDGYSQRVGDGLNAQSESWKLVWTILQDSMRNTIMDFFDAKAGVESFLWLTPRGQTKLFVVSKYDNTIVSFDNNTLTAQLDEDKNG